MSTTFSPADLLDMQGIILSGYGHLPYSEYIYLKISDPAACRTWLRLLIPNVTHGNWQIDARGKAKKPHYAVNLALGRSGVAALGLDPASAGFTEEFVQGMASPMRSRVLGDVGANDPSKWEFGAPDSGLDILLIIQAQSREDLEQYTSQHKREAAAYGLTEAIPSQIGYLRADSREHFGYVDSISQPNILGSPVKPKDDQPQIQPGDFAMGHLNAYGNLPASPSVSARDLGRNGSYLVLRKLRQDVFGFRKFVQGSGADDARREIVRAKLVGRWNSGAAITRYPTQDPGAGNPLNDFGYTQDPNGMGCPFGAHIRRSNPRDSLDVNPAESLQNVSRHRIVRRGVLYGDELPLDAKKDDGADRGILFIAINTDIQRQFEFIQQTWVTNPKFGGLYSDPDPIVGNADPSTVSNFTMPSPTVREQLGNLPLFVTMTGGAYFFLPSISALRYFSTGDAANLPAVPAPSARAAGLGAFLVATAGEFLALFFWLRFSKDDQFVPAVLCLLLGFAVERAAVVGWLKLPPQVRLANGKTMPLWEILVGVTLAEMALWVGWLQAARQIGLLLAFLPFFVVIHLIHCTESAVITKDTVARQLVSPGPVLLSVIESVTALLWVHFGLRGQFWLGAVCLLAGLMLEHVLQGIGLSRGRTTRPTAGR